MNERPRFFDDIAGMAGGAISALTGLRDEAEAMVKARVDEAIRKLDLVKREQLDAMAEVATKAREGQLAAESQLAALAARVAALEARVQPEATIPLPDETSEAAVQDPITPDDVPPGVPED